MSTKEYIADQLNITVDEPSNVLVASDIHLSARHTTPSRDVEKYLSKRIVYLGKLSHALVILNGDIFELWAGNKPSVSKALTAHKQLTTSLKNFSKLPNHQVIFVVGNHDGKLGWDEVEQQVLQKMIGAQICFSLKLNISTSKGSRSVLFEHGHQLDPENAFVDPRNPYEKPFGQYIVQKALPMVHVTQGELLSDINYISEPYAFPKFVASRVLYREIFSRLWWLLIPLFVILLVRLLVGYGVLTTSGYSITFISKILLYTELAVFSTVIVLIAAVGLIVSKVLGRAKTIPGGSHGKHHNTDARHKAEELITKGEVLGFVTGHTHRAEITHIKDGFFANSGCGTEMVDAAPTHLSLPKTYVKHNHLHWLELDIDKQRIIIDHWQMITTDKSQTLLEKLATKGKPVNESLHKEHESTIRY